MDIVFHRLVQRDLRAALAYYDEAGGSKLGDRFFADVEALVQKIQENPRRYHFFSAQFRRAPLSSFPYHFLYEECGGQLRVLVLRHDSRHPRFGLDRR